jgi:hypothetical protein
MVQGLGVKVEEVKVKVEEVQQRLKVHRRRQG